MVWQLKQHFCHTVKNFELDRRQNYYCVKSHSYVNKYNFF